MKAYKKDCKQIEEICAFTKPSFESFCEKKSIKNKNKRYFLGSISSLFVGFFVFVLFLVLAKLAFFINLVINTKNVHDSLYLFAFLVLFFVLLVFAFVNLRSYFKIKSINNLKRQFQKQKLCPNEKILQLSQILIKTYKNSLHVSTLQNMINSSDDYEMIYKFIENEFFDKLDKKAQNIIHKHALAMTLSSAISNFAIIDMALMFYQSVTLSKKIAQLYGFRPSLYSSFYLFKMGIFNITFAGISELAKEFASDIGSSEIISYASKSISQGLLNGILLARMGYAFMNACKVTDTKKQNFFKILFHSLKQSLKPNSVFDKV